MVDEAIPPSEETRSKSDGVNIVDKAVTQYEKAAFFVST